ncbi:hypothetical protein OG984_01120 [Nocardioides sp. NBC_00368]|uniref:hypothetical protein n=1 Tax=Nocardioides sp. NBC_00368 TaxID=2976000 RepID=UPI002E1FC1E4
MAARVPESERRFIAEIPLATTGGREDDQMRAIAAALDGADARRRARQSRRTAPRPG